jgi:hypothetical protein
MVISKKSIFFVFLLFCFSIFCFSNYTFTKNKLLENRTSESVQKVMYSNIETEDSNTYFSLDEQGFVRNWYYIDPIVEAYSGSSTNEKKARQEIIKKESRIDPLTKDNFNISPLEGTSWKLYQSCGNEFVEKYNFYYTLCALDFYGFTDIVVKEPITVKARFFSTRGAADLWCNGEHISRREQISSNDINSDEVELKLETGINRIFIRDIELGARNTPQLFGLQILDNKDLIKISLPGDQKQIADFFDAEKWLYSITFEDNYKLKASVPPPATVKINQGKNKINWNKNQDYCLLNMDCADINNYKLKLSLNIDNRTLSRTIEIPEYMSMNFLDSEQSHREEYLKLLEKYFETSNVSSEYNLIFKNLMGQKNIEYTEILKNTLKKIDNREDCSDFHLAAILRLYLQADLPEEDKKLIKKTILNFRYWSDEKGTDGMSMGSENHTLLFNSCQLIAGQLFPDDLFVRSGRKGSEQAEVAKNRINSWLTKVEKNGYDEFLSSSYNPVTMAGLTNLIDFSLDEGISERSTKLLDFMFTELAEHSIGGVTTAPQGRIYRDGVLYPQKSGTQAMLSYASEKAVAAANEWMVFLASSKYVVPKNLDELMSSSLEKTYTQGQGEITLKKTNDYMMSSLVLPTSKPQKAYIPGNRGAQQHLWDVSLNKSTRVFVNHPGASYENSSSRPGYWNGNGILPTLRQDKNMIMEIFNIPQNYPIQFTHAYWPSDQFDAEVREGNWIFGKKGTGFVALWCSGELQKYSDITLGRELRSYGLKSAWICIASSEEESGNFEDFINKCKLINPVFDENAYTLSVDGSIKCTWPK